jgi:RNA polymerase sigma-70 factor (ECF subfamily)
VDFEELYRATYPRVLAYARSMASREDADDAVAEAYAIAWRRQRSIPRGAELGWLIGVTRRVLANARRGRRRAGTLHALLDLQPRAAGPDPAEVVVDDTELRAALLSLSPLDREAVVLTAWFDLSSADAAQALRITPAAFRMRAARARRRLRAALAPVPQPSPTTTTQERPQWHTST